MGHVFFFNRETFSLNLNTSFLQHRAFLYKNLALFFFLLFGALGVDDFSEEVFILINFAFLVCVSYYLFRKLIAVEFFIKSSRRLAEYVYLVSSINSSLAVSYLFVTFVSWNFLNLFCKVY